MGLDAALLVLAVGLLIGLGLTPRPGTKESVTLDAPPALKPAPAHVVFTNAAPEANDTLVANMKPAATRPAKTAGNRGGRRDKYAVLRNAWGDG
jgi:hypothetical protein